MSTQQSIVDNAGRIKQFKEAIRIDDSPGDRFQALLKKHKINATEYQTIRDIMGRAPTMAELGVFSAMWSEHCSYKSSRVHLKKFPTTGPVVVVGPGENAGVVRLSQKLCVAFKMESHNHPSYIEPYQGAATGVGGILRDVFCMGARPVANLNCLRFGERSHERTSYLFRDITKGIGDYGNCVGIPTVGGNVSFDKTYNGNCLVNAMTVGLIHEDKIFKGYASGAGNLVVYVGSATGRDGIHGATMASDSFASSEASERSTVQVGDPFTEKLLLEATLEVLEKGLVVGLQDMGAAGLTSSSFEMAGRAGNGLYMELDRVPVRAQEMTAYELLLSESQERMLMVVEPGKLGEVEKILDRWQLAHGVIGAVTTTGRVQISHQGVLEVDMPVDPLTEQAPRYDRPRQPRERGSDLGAHNAQVARLVQERGLRDVLGKILEDTGEKSRIYEQYDQHIGTKTVYGPREDGAALLWIRSEWADAKIPNLGLGVAASCNERYCALNPRLGAAYAVLKSAQMLTALGAEPLAITDCLNYGNPEDPGVMAEFADGVEGISEACHKLGVPVVSGNVSLYNETDGVSIAPTPMIGMVGRHDDVTKAKKARASKEGRLLVISPAETQLSFGGSLVNKILGMDPLLGQLAECHWAHLTEVLQFVREAAGQFAGIDALRDVADGGVATAVIKMCLPGDLSYDIDTRSLREHFHAAITGHDEVEKDPLALFGEAPGVFVCNVSELETVQKIIDKAKGRAHVKVTVIGESHLASESAIGAHRMKMGDLETMRLSSLLI